MIGQRVGHYEVLRELGRGGMGVVYQARDLRLGRLVALKVLPPDKIPDEDRRRRFMREAKAASALNHPNIVTIHDIGPAEAHDPFYIVMEFVPGRTLADLISRGLPVGRAVDCAVQIADGLEAAHAIGIVHRDLKPANVMVTDAGLVKILDFGLAKLLGERVDEGAATVTEPGTGDGVVVGTCAYMAPEQAEGRQVDTRADIFALGAMLYEMLSGRRAFGGANALAVLHAVRYEEPPPLAEDTPMELREIVSRCLRKDPAERFESAAELKGALARAGHSLEPPAPRPSVAVLPFANLSADKENEYFSDGLAEDIIDALTRVPGLRVAARTSSFAFRGKETDIRAIGTALKVATILEGSVRRAGSRVRVTAQLVDAADGFHLWSQRFDREMSDVFAIQDEISAAIVDKLRLQLAPEDRPAARRTDKLDAYHLFLKGRHCLYKGVPSEIAKARTFFEQAAAQDPNYALPHLGLSEYYWLCTYWTYMHAREGLPQAKAAAERALRCDPGLAEARAMLGTLKGCFDLDWEAAEREFRRARELDPASVTVRDRYAFYYLRPLGRLQEAIAELECALEVDPLSLFLHYHLAYALHSDRRYDRAVAVAESALALDPDYFPILWILGVTQAICGRLEQSLALCRRATELSGRSPMMTAAMATALALTGREEEARAVIEELRRWSEVRPVPAVCFAWFHIAMEEWESALEWIERGIDERHPILVTQIGSEPFYDPLRSDPRFRAALRRLRIA